MMSKRELSCEEQARRWIVCHCSAYSIKLGEDIIDKALRYFDGEFDVCDAKHSWIGPMRIYVSLDGAQHLPYMVERSQSVQRAISDILSSMNIAMDRHKRYELWHFKKVRYDSYTYAPKERTTVLRVMCRERGSHNTTLEWHPVGWSGFDRSQLIDDHAA